MTAGSAPDAAWRACVAAGARPFDLVETMRFDPVAGVIDLDRHLARLRDSAGSLGFAFDRHETRNELQAATFHLHHLACLRLLLARGGALAIETRALPPPPPSPATLAIGPLPVGRHDPRRRHSTTDRACHDRARRDAGMFEIAFVDPDGFLTEGSFTSLFVARGGRLLTPPLARGLRPGVLRARLIDEGRAIEADLTPADLAGGCLIGNAVRGLIPAVCPAICVAPARGAGL